MIKNTYIIGYYTFREALSRKIFLTFSIISALVLLITSLILFSADISTFGGVTMKGGEIQAGLREVVGFIKMSIIMPLYAGGLFLSVFSASSFIPSMLEKGNIDLLLSKPISRGEILMGKYFGGITIVFLNIAFLVIGLWAIIGLRFGVWDPGLLTTIPTITFVFALLYSLIIFVGIVTQSSLLAMMLSYLIFFVVSPLLASREAVYHFIDSSVIKAVLDAFYFIIPQTSELGDIIMDIASGNIIDSYQPFFIAITFIILILTSGIFIFNKKDY